MSFERLKLGLCFCQRLLPKFLIAFICYIQASYCTLSQSFDTPNSINSKFCPCVLSDMFVSKDFFLASKDVFWFLIFLTGQRLWLSTISVFNHAVAAVSLFNIKQRDIFKHFLLFTTFFVRCDVIRKARKWVTTTPSRASRVSNWCRASAQSSVAKFGQTVFKVSRHKKVTANFKKSLYFG